MSDKKQMNDKLAPIWFFGSILLTVYLWNLLSWWMIIIMWVITTQITVFASNHKQLTDKLVGKWNKIIWGIMLLFFCSSFASINLIITTLSILAGVGIFISIVSLLLGLIKPSSVLYWRKDKTRKNVLLDYTIIIIVLIAVIGSSIEIEGNIIESNYSNLNTTFNNAIEFYETNEYDKALSILENKQFIDLIKQYDIHEEFLQLSNQVDSLKTLCFSSIKEEKKRVQFEEDKNIFYNAKNMFENGRYEDCLSELKKLSQKSEWNSKSIRLKKQSEEKIAAIFQQEIDEDAIITYNKAVTYFNDGFYEDCISELSTIPKNSKYYTNAKDLISKSKGMIPHYIYCNFSRVNFNLYSISGNINSKIGELYTGDKVKYLEEKSGWYLVNSNKLGKGWVETDAINTYSEFATKMLNDELSKWATLSGSVVEDFGNLYITGSEARDELVWIIDILKEDRDILNNINPPNKFIKAHRYAIDAFNNTIDADKEILLGLSSGFYDPYKYLDNTESAKSSKILALDLLKSH